MKTRAKPKKAKAVEAPLEEPPKLPVADSNPAKLFILNKNITNDATIITLAHSRTSKPTQYYLCPKSGLYEIRCTASDPHLKRSILLDPFESLGSEAAERDDSGIDPSSGYVLEDPSTYSITPIDPLFLLLPALKPTSARSDSERARFRSADDILETMYEQSKHLSRLAESPIRPLLEQRMAAVSDIVEAGDEVMYRLSERKLLAQLTSKAERISKDGLPASMEERFVGRPLEVPMLSVQSASQCVQSIKDGDQDEATSGDKSETQSSADSNPSMISMESQDSTETTITIPDTPAESSKGPDNVRRLQRLRVAINMIMSMYVPEHLAGALQTSMSSADSEVDFAPLENHLEFVAKAKADAAAARSMSDFTHKRGFDDDEVAAERAEKKQKKEEDEKRKKVGESRGVRDLKKVNVNGMKKMSDFFRKTPGK